MVCYWKVRISFLEVSVNVFGFIWFIYFVLLVLVCLGFGFLLVFFFLRYLSGDRIQDWKQFRLLFAY